MAKKATGPEDVPGSLKKKGRHQVTIDDDLAAKIGVITGALRVKLGDWVNSRLRTIVDVELKETLAGMGLDVVPKK